MDVTLPRDMDPGERAKALAQEKAYSQRLQRAGKWAHIWRVAGRYANLSIFDVADNSELHDILCCRDAARHP
jgi:muconolactone D-isomerase